LESKIQALNSGVDFGGLTCKATVDKQATDRNLERLAHEIGEVIEKAPPEEREQLRFPVRPARRSRNEKSNRFEDSS
jgi:hypothetical protein